MKVGDLVTLSAAGKKVDANWECIKGFGIIFKICKVSNHQWPIFCYWVGGKRDIMSFKRYELKRFKSQ